MLFNSDHYINEAKTTDFKEMWGKLRNAGGNPEFLKEDYIRWLGTSKFMFIDTDELKTEVMTELEKLHNMSVEEYTLYRKYLEIRKEYPELRKENISALEYLFNSVESEETGNSYLEDLKGSIWIPKSPDDYLSLKPQVVLTEGNPILTKQWQTLRVFTHTMLNNPNIGRNLRFLIIDETTKTFLGLICVSSDFMDLTCRDTYIGWSREVKTDKRMINHSTIASTICPTQPLGFSFVGGKLLALLSISEPIEKTWEQTYKDKLVSVTTTSLYGSFSQYNNLKYWSKRGRSAGSIKFEPSYDLVQKMRKWLKFHFPYKYYLLYEAKKEKKDKSGQIKKGMPLKRDHKQRSLSFIYSQLGIPKEYIAASHERGVYFCPLFKNSREFLRKEINESQLKRRFDNSVESLVEIWKTKYAKKRVERLLKNGRYMTNTLFYSDFLHLNWDEVREKYIGEVGR